MSEQKGNLETFEEKFDDVINEMQNYLISQKLSGIKMTYTNGWRFNLSIPKKEYQSQLNKSKQMSKESEN